MNCKPPEPSFEQRMADAQARWEKTFDTIVAQAESRHPADRDQAIRHAAKVAGLPATFTKPIYGTISRSGGVNWYSHDQLTRKKG